MGILLNGACHETDAHALDAFARDYPRLSSLGVESLAAVPSVSGGVLNASISVAPYSGPSYIAPITLQLPQCEASLGDGWTVEGVLIVSAFVFASLMGIRQGLHV